MDAFFLENPKTVCDLRSYGFFTSKKMENPKIKDHLPWQRHVLVLLVEKKKQHTDPHGEDKKKKIANMEWL